MLFAPHLRVRAVCNEFIKSHRSFSFIPMDAMVATIHTFMSSWQKVRFILQITHGLQATATFKKWYEVIARVAGDLVDAMVSYVHRITYADFFEEVAKRNPLKCNCGAGMELVRLYHPDRGLFYDLLAYAE